MRRIARHRLALAVPAFFVVRLAYFAAFGALNGYEQAAVVDALLIEVRQYTLVTLVLFTVLCRPTGSGNLTTAARAYLVEGRGADWTALDRRLLAIEAVGTALALAGAAGVAFFAVLPGRYVNRHSLAEAFGVRTVLGLDANGFFAFLVVGVALWGLAWILEGVTLSTETIYRRVD